MASAGGLFYQTPRLRRSAPSPATHADSSASAAFPSVGTGVAPPGPPPCTCTHCENSEVSYRPARPPLLLDVMVSQVPAGTAGSVALPV